ncbi:MAG TPA: hypothetical protein VJ819_14630 [Nocardioidaceae bacterium]|nr:hypothetical protein [Nocardioidaceae bacterium]
MGVHTTVEIDSLLGADGAAAMVELCERFGRYGMYSQEHVDSPVGVGLPQRYDALRNFLRSGGRTGNPAGEDLRTLGARTNYFREEYAYGLEPRITGIEPFLRHDAFVDAARAIFPDRPVVEPAIAFANLMVPGQELAVHTDVPEFRGCNRKVMPQWLLVAMHHSGLFEPWRLPIATGVSWFHDCAGGEFAYWPDGADGPVARHEVRYDTAVVLDADSVFHGVDRIASTLPEMAPLRPGMGLEPVGDGRWVVREGDAIAAEHHWDELRFSVSWKAYCFADEEEQATWRAHADDLTLDRVLEVLVADLRERGAIDGEVPADPELSVLIIDSYIRFP